MLIADAYDHTNLILDSHRDLSAAAKSSLRIVDIVVGQSKRLAYTFCVPEDCSPGAYDVKLKLWSPPKRYGKSHGLRFAETPWRGGFEVLSRESTWQKSPVIFFSYSWDSEDHKAWVLRLSEEFMKHDTEVLIDVKDFCPGEDTIQFIERGITDSDFVVLVCSDRYTEKANSRQAGVGIETVIGSAEYYRARDKRKFVPITRNNGSSSANKCPKYLGMAKYVDFDKDHWPAEPMQEVIRSIRAKMLDDEQGRDTSVT